MKKMGNSQNYGKMSAREKRIRLERRKRNRRKRRIKQLLRISLVVSIFIFLVLGVVLIASKSISYFKDKKNSDSTYKVSASANGTNDKSSSYSGGKGEGLWLDEGYDTADGTVITIPKESGITKENINFDEQYLKKCLVINIDGSKKSFYDDKAVSTNTELTSFLVEGSGNGVTITLGFNAIYAFYVNEDDSNIYIKYVKPKEKYDKIVVVDFGHGGTDPGSGAENDGYTGLTENEIILGFANKIIPVLDAKENVKVYYTRVDDQAVGWDIRLQVAYDVEADCILSVHCNYLEASKGTADGTEVMYDQFSETSKSIAQICEEEAVKALGTRERGLLEGRSIYMIRTSTIPMVIIETGFLSDSGDYAKLTDDNTRQSFADALSTMIDRIYSEVSFE